MHIRNILNTITIGLVVLISAAIVVPVSAQPNRVQAGSAMDLVNAVNAYRTSVNLAPYEVDSRLNALAQGHSEYQAGIQTCTHNRADGSGPSAQGISAENIACGQNLSVQAAIYSQWADSLHLATMLGPTSGRLGAGVAISGDTVYYTIDVQRLSGEFVYNSPVSANTSSQSNAAVNNPPDQPQYQGGWTTSTPNPDGSTAHIVHYGDTLVDIAATYGVPMNDIISINNLDSKNPYIYERQVLIIRLAPTATVYVTPTRTPRPATRTPMPTRTPRPTQSATLYALPPTLTALPTATLTPAFHVPTLEDLGSGRSIMAYAFIAISTLGLLVLIFTSFGGPRGDHD